MKSRGVKFVINVYWIKNGGQNSTLWNIVTNEILRRYVFVKTKGIHSYHLPLMS